MSEEIIQKNYEEHGLKVSKYQFYNLGATTISTLKKYKIVPDRNYKKYEKKKPDALLVERNNKSKPTVVAVIEHKSPDEFRTEKQRKEAMEQCNNYAQVLKAKVGIATDKSEFIWFNPNHKNPENEYHDQRGDVKRSYSIIQDENDRDFIGAFLIDQQTDEIKNSNLSTKTKKSIANLELISKDVKNNNSKIQKNQLKDPTPLAKQIWQDIWSVTGRDPEKCLYTFIELFIFKYLSDLEILDKDKDGHQVNFNYIVNLEAKESFGNYTSTVRPYLKSLFKPSEQDNTTIINGTVLNTNVSTHRLVFHKILKRFKNFGPMNEIDPQFKSRVFEEFMKQSISTKNWGRYFTPRNVIDAMVMMSDIDKLEEKSKVCDPACGVGGFVLEPLKVKNDTKFYYRIENNKIIPRLDFYGYDKGFEKDEQLTIILAKANMLIFLSEMLKENPEAIEEFSNIFNDTFELTINSIMGTLNDTTEDKYDLILTNPPYVTSGSSNYKEIIRNDANLKKFYKVNAMGVESLFLEWIIRSLKPSKKAFIVIPDGIVNRSDSKLRRFIKDQCYIDGIVSLPINTFYTTPKKTYILAITKKSERTDEERKEKEQAEPVFTYLVSNIGETLDANRFKTPENDLTEMITFFKQFVATKSGFTSTSHRCKIFDIDKFDPAAYWSVDRWWSKEEKIELGIEKEEIILTLEEFIQKTNDLEARIHGLTKQLMMLHE